MVRRVCRAYGLRRVALFLLLLASVAIERAEAVSVEEVIGERCPRLATVPDQGPSDAAPPGALNCSPESAECYVVPMAVFCPTAFPVQAKSDDRTSLTRHLVVMNTNPRLLFNISQFEIRSKSKNVASPIKGCTGDFHYLDRCIVSLSEEDADVKLYIRDEISAFEQRIDFSGPCTADLTGRLQLVLRLFDDLPAPSGSGEHRVTMLTVPRESKSYYGEACARSR